MIESRLDEFKEFKARNKGKRWASGKQRAKLAEYNIKFDENSLTLEDAAKLITQHLADHSGSADDDAPATDKQKKLLTDLGHNGECPATRTLASALIKQLIERVDKATSVQLSLLRNNKVVADPNILSRLTKKQASTLLTKFFDKERREKFAKRNYDVMTSCKTRNLDDDSDDDDPKDKSNRPLQQQHLSTS